MECYLNAQPTSVRTQSVLTPMVPASHVKVRRLSRVTAGDACRQDAMTHGNSGYNLADVRHAQNTREDKTITHSVLPITAHLIPTLSLITTVLVQDAELGKQLTIDKGNAHQIGVVEITVVNAHSILNIVKTVCVLLAQNIREGQKMAEVASKMIASTPNNTTHMMAHAKIVHHIPEPITMVNHVKLMSASRIKDCSLMEDAKVAVITLLCNRIGKAA